MTPPTATAEHRADTAAPGILIVEDEAIVALDLRLQLQELGYRVVGVAASGDQALGHAERDPPSLVLMDVRLQGPRDGIETAAELRRRQDVPVIFLTSHSDQDTVQRAARTAPYGYLTKPYQLKELRAGIEVALTKARMERQLREADRWFAHTLQCVADGVVVTDLEGRVRFVNPAAEAMTGWTLDEAAGRAVADVVTLGGEADRGPGADAVVRAVLQDGRPCPVVHARRLHARGGRSRLIDETAGPVDDDQGRRLGAVLVLRDADARVAQEARLRASEERFRRAFDHAPLGMALVSLAGAVMQANDALCRLLGQDAVALSRLTLRQLDAGDDPAHETRRLLELLGGMAGVVQYERRFRRADGSAVETLVSASLLHEGGAAAGYLFQVHDLTQQKQAAQHLAALAEERLKREASELASAAKSEFLSRVSHEMRTPLNAVIGFAQLLQLLRMDGGGTAAASVGTYASHIRSAGEHMLALVEDLLDLHKAARGELRLQCVPTPLAPLATEAAELLRPLADDHGIALSVAVDAALAVQADGMRLRQVLLNLLSNAIKYNRQGGSVRLSAEAAGAPPQAVLVIADTGIGMTAEQCGRLFQPFERLGLERSSVPGTGLGLVIARSLVEQMGGTLAVDSLPRQGTTVTLRLPLASGATAPA